jgi:hypothetical protein
MRERAVRELVEAVQLDEMGVYREQDLFIVGYPKSGNTWLQNIVAALRYGLRPEDTPDSMIQRLVPDVHARPYYMRFQDSMAFKSHDLPKPEFRSVIYIVRDGRDVLVSYYHYLCNQRGETLDHRLVLTEGDHLFGGLWQNHVAAWEENPYGAKLLLVRYEDLKTNIGAELRRISDFIGVSRSDEELERVAGSVTFAKMRLQEERFGSSEERLGSGAWAKNWAKDKRFIRRGVIGSYKDELPEEILRAFIEQAGSVLARYYP